MKHISEKPRVSVIIPVYNRGLLLARAIESVLTQTYPFVEVVVINDGSSTPVTRQTAVQFQDRIVYLEQDNAGVAAARNTGIAAATGELIALLDSDDLWLPEKLTTQVRTLQEHPHVGTVHSSFYHIDNTGRRTGLVRLPEGEWAPLRALLLDMPISPSTALIPRYVLDEVGSFDPQLNGADDWDWFLRAAIRGYRFYALEIPLAEYRRHPGNLTRNTVLLNQSGLLLLDKFYAGPDVPAEAQQLRNRAYFTRHAGATAVYYGAGNLDSARTHLEHALHYYPAGITTGRFLQSLIYSRSRPPTLAVAAAAIRFVCEEWVIQQLPPPVRRRLIARARLVLALHRRGGARLIALTQALLTAPWLIADPEVWTAGRRRFKQAGARLQRRAMETLGRQSRTARSNGHR